MLLRAALLLLLLAGSASAQQTGVVFVDGDGDGRRDAGEPARAGVFVTNGVEVVASDASGRYALSEREGFVYLTCPQGFACPEWYRAGGGDFALLPDAGDDAFFIQISDSHVFDRVSDFAEHSSPVVPWFIPQFVVDWLTLRQLQALYGDDVLDRLREALAPYQDTSSYWFDVSVYAAYRAEFARPGSPFAEVAQAARDAFAELAALRPAFVIATGDLVLESNQGTAEAIERWFSFYDGLARQTGLRFYNTIGNNEIAGTQNPDFAPEDPRYGKHFFETFFGPTYYSFDRAGLHFVALDTHRHEPRPDEPEWWSFQRMPPEERDWLEADLVAHAGRRVVVLNHEPFHYDPAWPFEDDQQQTADDEGLFATHGVPYVLSGHTHWNSLMRGEQTTHITTGALSGLRWVLPTAVHERGYRLFYARDGELYSAWKRTGEPLFARAEGAADAASVIVVADRDGPFAAIEVERDGGPSQIARWGDYFVRVASGAGARLRVTGVRASGERVTVDLD